MCCFKHSRFLRLSLVLFGSLWGISTIAGQQGEVSQGEPPTQDVSVNGKYSKLARKLYFPKDAATYGQFCDFGYSPTPVYGQFKDLPKGYWVYAAPFWYIWENKDSHKDDTLQRASMNGKYSDLLFRVPSPQSLKDIGKYKDSGYSATRQFGDFNNLPPGYWVYTYPHWYIWRKQGAPLTGAALKASAGCKYYNLLKKISVPLDQSIYSDYFDEGYWDGSTYGPYMNLPKGFWVYSSPHWYIWGDQQSIRTVVNKYIAGKRNR